MIEVIVIGRLPFVTCHSALVTPPFDTQRLSFAILPVLGHCGLVIGYFLSFPASAPPVSAWRVSFHPLRR